MNNWAEFETKREESGSGWVARTLIMTLGMLVGFTLFSSPANAQIGSSPEQVEAAAYSNDPLRLIAYSEATRAYTRLGIRPDRLEIWACNTHSGEEDLEVHPTQLVTQFRGVTLPYFSWLSGGLYAPEFVAGGTVTVATDRDCKNAVAARTRSESKEFTGVIIMANTKSVTSPSGEDADGYAGPGHWCSEKEEKSNFCVWPLNERYAILESNRDRSYAFHDYTLLHEIGHMLSFPHSFSDENDEYSNRVDIMSGGARTGTLAINRYAAGWMHKSQVEVHPVSEGNSQPYALYELSSIGQQGTQMLVLPVRPGEFYTLGARVKSGYDGALPLGGEGVEVYIIDQSLVADKSLIGQSADWCDHGNTRNPVGVTYGVCYGLGRRTKPFVASGSFGRDFGHVYSEGGGGIKLDDARNIWFRVLERTADRAGYTVWVGPGPLEGYFFDDEGSTHEMSINWLATKKVTQGCDKHNRYRFCPKDKVTRAQMVVFLARFLGLTVTADNEVSDTGFDDVLQDAWYAGHLNALGQIAAGDDDETFRPSEPITRGEMAIMLNRALELDAGENRNTAFTDVRGGTELATASANLYAAEITQGSTMCHNSSGSEPLFCPDDSLTRGQMAAFLHRSWRFRDSSDDDDDDEESRPDGREIRISWGTDASSRTGCPQGAVCRNYSYEYIGDFGPVPYTLECWINGERAWPPPGEGPRIWFGKPEKGCWVSGSDRTVSHVVVDGVNSNELPWVQSADVREVRISVGRPSTRCTRDENCGGLHRDYDYELTGFGPGPYELECWARTSGDEWDLERKLIWSGDPAEGCFSWGESGRQTVYVEVDGVKSNELPWIQPDERGVQTEWYVNDDPILGGTERYWLPGHGKGYGDNRYEGSNYVYTFADSDASEPNNTALWEMGNRIGRQEIQVYIPSNNATATVDYKIRIHRADDTITRSEEVEQVSVSGWISLGTIDSNGSKVSILVEDNGARQDWVTDEKIWSSIGIDAIQMRCVSDCTLIPGQGGSTRWPGG